MFHLISERLMLIPLDLNQLQLLKQHRAAFEQSLGLENFGIEISIPAFIEEFQTALENWVIPNVTQHQADYQWFTVWQIIHRTDNRGVGTIGVNGLPNEHGEVMIGYFTDARYEGQGIMTEAVQCLLNWIFQNAEVQSVIADTLVDGTGSQRVLAKNGFVQDGTTEEGIHWRKQR
ncbi:MAG: GNAT family N-acetyltransferase [Saprospiraceae bacterium]